MHTDFSRGRSSGLVFPSHSEFFTVYCNPHSQRLWHSQQNRSRYFLELSCFFNDPIDVGNLISHSSAFSKCSLNIWKYIVHILLKPGLENLNITLLACEMSAFIVVWAFFGIAFLWDWNENWPFPVLWPLLHFPNLLAYWVQHFHSIIFQDLKQQIILASIICISYLLNTLNTP